MSISLSKAAILKSSDGNAFLFPALGERFIDETNQEECMELLLGRLTLVYGRGQTENKINYDDEQSLHFLAAKDLLRRAIEKHYTVREFFARLDEMTENCPFPTWTPADFFKKERAKLYTHAWYLNELQKNPSIQNQIEVYEIGEEMYYHIKTGKRLPFTMLYPTCEKKFERKPEPDQSATAKATKEEFDMAIEYFRIKRENEVIRGENHQLRLLVKELEERIPANE